LLRCNTHAASRAYDEGTAIPLKKFPYSHWQKSWLSITLAAGAFFGTACRSIHRMPLVDLSSPGWSVCQGQAVWKPTRTKPELAGELIVATNTAGDFFVQFSKLPFTLATAQRIGAHWQIEFGAGDVAMSGRGRPPSRLAWLELPHAIARGNAARPWQFEGKASNAWLLENPRTGETIEGYLLP